MGLVLIMSICAMDGDGVVFYFKTHSLSGQTIQYQLPVSEVVSQHFGPDMADNRHCR